MGSDASRSRQRGLPIGALLLVAVGVLLLLNTTGVVGWSIWFELWQFWPVLLIIAGINMLVKRRAPIVAGVLVLAGSGAAAYALSEPTDGLIWRLRPTAERAWAFTGFAIATVATFFALYFSTLAVTDGLGWPVELWAGSVLLSGVVGWLLSYVAVPPIWLLG